VVIRQRRSADFRLFFADIAKKSSRENKYIQSATLNGKEWNKPWFSWDDIKDGGVLVLDMGSKPNYQWGKDPSVVPLR
jgi:putative alpha-1,2-mannosidase